MQDKPSESRTVDALLSLAAQADPSDECAETYKLSPPTDVAPPPPVELPPMGPVSSADPIATRLAPRKTGPTAEDRWKLCLYCGYMLDTRELRCPECGTLFAPHVYERWFSGEEEKRFESVRWLLLAAIFMKLWMWLPGIGPFANLLALVAIAAAGWRAAEHKEGTAGMYGLAATALCLVMGCLGIASGKPFAFVLECTIAGLLLAGMLSDAERFDVLAERGYKRVGFILIFASPALAGVFLAAERVVAQIPSLAAGPASTAVQWAILGGAILLNLVAWAYTTWTVHRISRTLFSPGANID